MQTEMRGLSREDAGIFELQRILKVRLVCELSCKGNIVKGGIMRIWSLFL